MILDDPIYTDASGANQTGGFAFSVESNAQINEGWFNEGSIQSILYDLYDAEDDNADTLTLGLKPIYDVLTSDEYRENTYVTSIFSFITELNEQQGDQAAQISNLLLAQAINGTGAAGLGERNDGRLPQVLPIFKPVTSNGSAIELCSSDVNGAGVRDFASLTINQADTYTINFVKQGNSADADPDFIIWQSGDFITVAQSSVVDSETWRGILFPGEYIIDFFDFQFS